MDIHDRLRLARRSAGLSQRQLAVEVDVHRSAVAQWESCSGTVPSVRHLIDICHVTDVMFEWLATGRGPRQREHNRDTTRCEDERIADELERRIIETLRRLPSRRKNAVANLLEVMLFE